MRRNPQKREGSWDGTVEVDLQVKVTSGGSRDYPPRYLCMFDPLQRWVCRNPYPRALQEAQSTPSFSPLLWDKSQPQAIIRVTSVQGSTDASTTWDDPHQPRRLIHTPRSLKCVATDLRHRSQANTSWVGELCVVHKMPT